MINKRKGDTMSESEYKKNKSNRKGTDYELVLLMLVLKRAVEMKIGFNLATERKHDEKFDDLFVKIGETEKIYYLQAKHREDISRKITNYDLTSRMDSDFSLLKYFNSFIKIKEREEKTSWECMKFIITTTIHLDCIGLCSKGIKVKNPEVFDGIFRRDDSQMADFYELEISSDKIKKDIFKESFSSLQKMARKMAECIIKEKNINIEQLPIIKSYHIPLAMEVVDISDCRKIKFRDEFVNNSNHLSPKCKKFREIFYNSVRCLLKEMSMEMRMGSLHPKARANYEGILNKYKRVIDKDVSCEKSETYFWENLKYKKLKFVGKFGQFEIKEDEKFTKFIQKYIKKYSEPLRDIVELDATKFFGKDTVKLIGYVLMIRDDSVKFNEDFLRRKNLPPMLENFRNKLRDEFGDKDFNELGQHTLNFPFSPQDREKASIKKVYWELDDEYLEDEAEIEIDDFLKKLMFVVTPTEDKLAECIKGEMRKEFGPRNGDSIFSILQAKLIKWSKCLSDRGTGTYLSKGNNPYEETIKKYPRSIWFRVNKPVASFTGRVEDLAEVHSMLQSGEGNAVLILQNVLLSGMGGIGKSELARKYAEVFKEHYEENVIWVEAETATKMLKSFEMLANMLCIERIDDYKKHPENIVQVVYKYFARKKSLFIFDNAEEYRDMKEFLPNVGNDMNKPYIIITSRNRELFNTQEHGKVNKLLLGLLSVEEAVEFVKKTIESKHSNEYEIRELVVIMGCLPLALQHAVAYINQSEYGIGKYVRLYRESLGEVKSLLNREQLDSYDRTIFLTFKMAVEKIKKKDSMNNLAVEILNIIAYVSSENILRNMFIQLALRKIDNDDDDEEDVKKERAEMLLSRSLKLLRKYSMVDFNEINGTISIHRLVQQVIRLYLNEEDKKKGIEKTDRCLGERDTLRKALELLYELKDMGKLSSHLTSLWCHTSKHHDLIENFYFKHLQNNTTPLHLLSADGYLKEIGLIFKCLKAKNISVIIGAKEITGRTPLFMAAQNNRLHVVKSLVQNGAQVDDDDSEGNTPLCVAASRGHQDVVMFLVDEAGADMDKKKHNGHTSVSEATYFGHLGVVKFLTEDFDSVKRAKYVLHSILSSATNYWDLKYVEKLLEGLDKWQVVDVLNTEMHGVNLLGLAAFLGKTDVAEYLIANGANIETRGYTQLHHASREGHLDVVKLLVSKGGDPKNVDDFGVTSLHLAAEGGHLSVVRYFLDNLKGNKSIDVSVRDKNGYTPLNVASSKGQIHVMKFLLKRGASVSKDIIYDMNLDPGGINYELSRFLRKSLKMKDYAADNFNNNIECKVALEKHELTALNVAAALDELNILQTLLLDKNMQDENEMEDILLSLQIAQIYRRLEVCKYLLTYSKDQESSV